jgi:hypothetical protein
MQIPKRALQGLNDTMWGLQKNFERRRGRLCVCVISKPFLSLPSKIK